MHTGLKIGLQWLLILFPWVHLEAQDIPQSLEVRLARFEHDQALAREEQLYVFSDKYVYFAGEMMWFSCHFIGHNQRIQSNESKVVYLELLSPRNMPIIQQKVQMTGGCGRGEFVIPDTLSTGNYLLRAYTLWMRNYGKEAFFSDVIQVYNPAKSPPSWTNGSRNTDQRLNMIFFPEGGTLCKGIENKVAVIAKRINGEGVSLQGVVFNDGNEIITSFRTDASGLGSFILTPEDKDLYYCKAKDEGQDFIFDLPIIQTRELSMQVNNLDPGDLTIGVYSDHTIGTNNQQQCHLVIQSMGEIRYRTNCTVQDTVEKISIPRSILSPGINQVLLFDHEGQLHAERLIFNPLVRKEQITIEVKDQLQVREKVNIDIRIDPETFTNGEMTRISVSVSVPTRPFNDRPILYHYYVASFLSDPVEADMLLRDIHQGIDSVIDLRMLTLQSYKYPVWSSVPTKDRRMLFPKEKNGMYVTGNLVHRGSGLPVVNGLLYLSFPGLVTRFAYAYTGPDGMFRFSLPDYYGTRDLIIQPARLNSEEIRININNSFSLDYISWAGRIAKADTIIFPRLREWSINAQLQRIYGRPERIKPAIKRAQGRSNFYGTTDKVVILDDFVTLPVMEEVYHELVYGVRLRKAQSDYEFVILDKVTNTPMGGIPSVFFDGVYVHDPNQIAELNPERIDRIEVVREFYQVGDIQMDGILSIYSKDGSSNLIEMPVTAVRRTYSLFDQPGFFVYPDYADPSSGSSRTADMRNTLFWGPNIPVDQDGMTTVHFYTSDFKSEYEILVQGITDRGEIIYARKTIIVK